MTIKQLFSGLGIEEIKTVFNLVYWHGVDDANSAESYRDMDQVFDLAMKYAAEMIEAKKEDAK